jgi:hypothetical protein
MLLGQALSQGRAGNVRKSSGGLDSGTFLLHGSSIPIPIRGVTHTPPISPLSVSSCMLFPARMITRFLIPYLNETQY